MGIQINGNTDNISATDGGLTVSDLELNQTGVSTFHSHLHVADQIIHLDDANSKIRFPAADTITAETAGTERLRITSSGEVKIMNTSGTVGLYFQSSSGAVSNFRAIGTNNQSLGYFFGNTEKVRFASNGRIGVGTITPTVLTHIYDSTNTSTATEQFRISGGNRTADNIETGFRFFTESPSVNGNRHVRFTSNGNTGLIIQPYETSTGNAAVDRNISLCPSGGKLTLGTSTSSSNAAAYMFTVADPTNSLGNCGISIRSGTGGGSNTNEGSIFFSDATSGAGEYAGFVQYSHVTNWLRFGTASAPRVYIDSSGRMLIGGTTTEGYGDADDLTIATAGNTGMTIRAGASNYGSIFFSDATSGDGEYDGFIQYGHSARSLAIGTASATKLNILANGHVNTQGNNIGNPVGMELRNNNTAAYSHAELSLTSQNTTTSKVWCDVPNARMRFQYNGGTTVGIDQSGNVQLASGSGISFAASGNFGTMNSEILDDYEEGYWTPTIGGHISNGSTTYGNQKGSYVRIGGIVHLNWYISWTSTSASGQFRIYGQPYVASVTYGTNYNITTGSMMFDSINVPYQYGQMVPYLAHGVNQIVFYSSYHTQGWNILSHDSYTTDGGSMIASITYRAS